MPVANLGPLDADNTTALYIDEQGRAVSTHSMLKTFRRCPKQAEFKYYHRLKPRLPGGPLKRGKWVHELLEVLHNGGDWRALHTQLSQQFEEMFDEEKDFYGDMPTEIFSIMVSYEWHYKYDPWKVIETEFTVETEFPDGNLYRGKVDALVENQFGLWVVDHKTHKTLPDHNFRLLDAQSALYLWACLRNRIPVQGFIWNYVRWKAPSTPKLVQGGTRLSKSPCDSDYLTYRAALAKYKAESPQFKITREYLDRVEYYKAQRYRPGEPQTSSFFRRDVMEKSNDILRRVAKENYRTSQRMHAYDFSDPERVERVVETSCKFRCDFTDICATQMMGGNMMPLLKQNYKVGDPMDYYEDRAGEVRGRDDS